MIKKAVATEMGVNMVGSFDKKVALASIFAGVGFHLMNKYVIEKLKLREENERIYYANIQHIRSSRGSIT